MTSRILPEGLCKRTRTVKELRDEEYDGAHRGARLPSRSSNSDRAITREYDVTTEGSMDHAISPHLDSHLPYDSPPLDTFGEDIYETTLSEPERGEGTLSAVSERLYTRINSVWQTRIIKLLPASAGSKLEGELIVADIVMLPGLVLHEDQRLISYQALSYCCGPQILSRRIKLQCERLPITENLYLALQSLRQSEAPIYIWVDAICIHQNDPEEKARQVVNMRDIYHKADQVDIWLGESGRNTKFAMRILSRSSTVKKVDAELVLHGIRDIFSRPYFRRVWVKQEVYAAKRASVHCGSDTMTGDFKHIRLELLEAELGVKGILAGHEYDLKAHVQLLRSFYQATQGELIHRNHSEKPNPLLLKVNPLDIVNILRRCAGSRSSDPRDHVYALLGMSDLNYHASSDMEPNDRALVVDYTKSAAEVFTDLTKHVIRRDNDLGMLLLDTSYGSKEGIPGLPSWVPDLRFARPRWSWLHNDGIPIHRDELVRHKGFSHEKAIPAAQCSNQLSLTGTLVGHLGIENSEFSQDSPPLCLGSDLVESDDWNYFHERHVNRHEFLPEQRSIPPVVVTKDVEAEGSDLQSIHTAILSLLIKRDLRRSEPSPHTYDRNGVVRINVLHENRQLGFVLFTLRDYYDVRRVPKHVLPMDSLAFGKCWYADEYIERRARKDISWREDHTKRGKLCVRPTWWTVPKSARDGDLMVLAVGSPLILVLRPRPLGKTYEFVGHAMPCQMSRRSDLPLDVLADLFNFTKHRTQQFLLD